MTNSNIHDYLTPGHKAHLIGIGGVSMSPLAEVLHKMGVEITGSDMNDSATVEHLRALGIPVTVADCRAECTFYFPAVCEGGGVTAGLISQHGADHRRAARAARAVRQALEGLD